MAEKWKQDAGNWHDAHGHPNVFGSLEREHR